MVSVKEQNIGLHALGRSPLQGHKTLSGGLVLSHDWHVWRKFAILRACVLTLVCELQKNYYEAECPGFPGHFVQIRKSSRSDFDAQPDKVMMWPKGNKSEKVRAEAVRPAPIART